MNAFSYLRPETLEEALALLQEHGDDAKVIAGGTALIIMLKQHLVVPEVLISLERVPGLDQVQEVDGTLRLGGLLTHRAAELSPLIRTSIPVLAETHHNVATIRIRNMATVAGALAHADPNQDPPVTLLALDARVRTASATGERDVALEDFFTDYYETVLEPEELLTEVCVPLPPFRTGSVYLKFLPRSADDYATVGVAATVRLDASTGACDDCRIAMGCVGVTPLRAPQAENLLRGQQRSDELFREAGAVAQEVTDPISDTRGSAAYKRSMAGVFVRRALDQAWQQALTSAP
ncbi:6-hydroxypseudooxynicotine dehydrogenase complex subunit alpha [Candidatus Entotheonellaceae bacterium PAL068K]